jgi:hypothetical protein
MLTRRYRVVDAKLAWEPDRLVESRRMARIPLVDPSSDDGESEGRAALQDIDLGGIHPNVYRAIANHPGALAAFSTFGKMVYFESSLTPAQRELAYLTASATNNCHY